MSRSSAISPTNDGRLLDLRLARAGRSRASPRAGRRSGRRGRRPRTASCRPRAGRRRAARRGARASRAAAAARNGTRAQRLDPLGRDAARLRRSRRGCASGEATAPAAARRSRTVRRGRRAMRDQSRGRSSAPSASEPTITLSRQPKTRAGDLGRRGPLQERHRRDVDQRVADADDPERERRDDRGRGRADEQRAAAPQSRSPIAKSAAIRARATSDSATAAPSERADPAGSLQQADPGRPEPEQLQRDHDDEHAERAGDEALCAVEPDQQAEARLGGDRLEAGRPDRLGPSCDAPSRGSAPAGVWTRDDEVARSRRTSRRRTPKAPARTR